MNLLLLIDHDRAQREHTMVARVTAGLTERGVAIQRLMPPMPDGGPDGPMEDVDLGPAIRTMREPLRLAPWTRWLQLRSLERDLARRTPDVILAMGVAAWPLAIQIGRALDRPVAIDLHDQTDVPAAARATRSRVLAAVLVSSLALQHLAQERIRQDLIEVVPYGVPVPAEPRPSRVAASESLLAVGMLGLGDDLPALRAALSALARVAAEAQHELHIAMELAGPNAHGLWNHANALDLLPKLASVANADHIRGLLTRCDVVPLPRTRRPQ